jgi:protein required for attachment to host cells
VTVHVERAQITWVVVADDNRARVFSFGDKLKPWALVHDLAMNAKGELHDAVSGRSEPPRHEPPTTPHRLGHELVHFLDKHLQAHELTRIVFVAPPHLLGFLRGHVSRGLEQALVLSLAKEYSHLQEPELRAQLESALPV